MSVLSLSFEIGLVHGRIYTNFSTNNISTILVIFCSSILIITYIFLCFSCHIILLSLLFFFLYVVYCSTFCTKSSLLLLSFQYFIFSNCLELFYLSRGFVKNNFSISMQYFYHYKIMIICMYIYDLL